ncbi:extracellular solute-binding protein [Calidifontibacter sp. DB0510]|uniref:Extracellular solute-binding protein n=1 Tax=Metallococcus carri TaxID=1656884 RepID=A0A967B140_9MICO|nr:extracellular solute-binding protein [Metallococcus carri]NHN55528.1 extracellular solute-binding protein [Metallococcus carri]NOP38288.1 extracellular solute-binding protein [Calidifontibacter sp. DB2511S]
MTAPRTVRRAVTMSVASLGVFTLAACGGGGGFTSGSAPSQNTKTAGGVKLTMMIGSSGPAETKAVQDATAAWGKSSGNTVNVVAASNLDQQLGQGFAGANPPDVFYVDASKIGTYAKAGYLFPYGDQLDKSTFEDSLVQAFSYQGKFYCAPKDSSTLALQINTDLWKAAGLTDKDYPTTWAQLETVAKKLTKGNVTGLVIGNDHNRGGAFMVQAGGWLQSGGKITATDPGNVKGLQEVQKLMQAGVLKYNTQTKPSTGWGGEALGKKVAAMTIEGNWIAGGMKDFPGVKYKTVELPAGPAGKGSLMFSNCWGIAAKSKNQAAAVALVKQLITPDQQMKFAADFGVMPSTKQGLTQFEQKYPDQAAFVKAAAYAKPPINLPGLTQATTSFDSAIGAMTPQTDATKLLQAFQKNADAAASGN